MKVSASILLGIFCVIAAAFAIPNSSSQDQIESSADEAQRLKDIEAILGVELKRIKENTLKELKGVTTTDTEQEAICRDEQCPFCKNAKVAQNTLFGNALDCPSNNNGISDYGSFAVTQGYSATKVLRPQSKVWQDLGRVSALADIITNQTVIGLTHEQVTLIQTLLSPAGSPCAQTACIGTQSCILSEQDTTSSCSCNANTTAPCSK